MLKRRVRPSSRSSSRVAEREADLEPGRGVVEPLRLRPRHRRLEEGVDLGLDRRCASAERRWSAPSRETPRSRPRRLPPAPAGGRGGRPSRHARRCAGSARSGRPRWSGIEPWRRLLDRFVWRGPDRRRCAARIVRRPGLRPKHAVGDHRHAAHQNGGRLAGHLPALVGREVDAGMQGRMAERPGRRSGSHSARSASRPTAMLPLRCARP